MDQISPLVTLFAGAILDLLASLCTTYLQHKHDVIIKIIEKFFEAREELSNRLCILADLQIISNLEVNTIPDEGVS